MSIYRYVYVILFLFSFLIQPVFSEEQIDNSIRTDVINKRKETLGNELTRIKTVSGETIIDGSMRVLEPIYLKEADLVEISTSVTPAANHVRIFIVAVGTYSVIKAQFDNGTLITLGNN